MNNIIKEIENAIERDSTGRPDYITHTVCRRKALKSLLSLVKKQEEEIAL